jgi:hypothetical protein
MTWSLGEKFSEVVSYKTFLMILLQKSNSIFDPAKEVLYQVPYIVK